MHAEGIDVIEAVNISKAFGTLQALNNVTFSVPQGSVFSILGPNGAGKTTLLKVLTTILQPDNGQLKIFGLSVPEHNLALRQKIGIVAQENRFDRYLDVWHNLTLHAQLHGMPARVYESRITELLKFVGLYDRRFQMTDTLSGGMERRLSLIRALIHEPALLFLDEPSTGLDPEARQEIWKMISRFKATSTIILTTHYMEEADTLSDRIMMLNQGEVVLTGTPRELKKTLSPKNRYEIIFNGPKAPEYVRHFNEAVPESAHQADDYRIELALCRPDDLKGILDRVDMRDLNRVGLLEADLEEVFMAVARNGKTDASSERK